jgi:cytoskeletal protein RodZ
MRSLGETIKDKRKSLGITRSDLARETKIRKEFLEGIESSTWQNLPEFPVVQGFVRSIAHVLEIDEALALALLRRDYPTQSLPLNPKPDVKNKFIWSPKWTLIAGAVLVTLVIVGYLGFQYRQFVSPPTLIILKPKENEIITTSNYIVSGKTNPDATVIINNQPTLVFDDGTFEEEIEIALETKEIVVKATSRSGKETEVVRKVEVKP